jgi:hypothetical protein
MEVTAELDAPCPPTELFSWVEHLDRYPSFLEIVTRAERVPATDGDASGDAWAIDLRGRLGPLARTKRLRMVRTVHDAPQRVVFERRELDGRDHSAWRLTAAIVPEGAGCRLSMSLHYGGSLFGPLVERALRDEIERSRPRLLALVSPTGRG